MDVQVLTTLRQRRRRRSVRPRPKGQITYRTRDLDPQLAVAVQALAAEQGVRVGQALNAVVRAGLKALQAGW